MTTRTINLRCKSIASSLRITSSFLCRRWSCCTYHNFEFVRCCALRYSSMYSMPQGNGFCGNPYGNNSNKLLSQQSNQQQSVAAPFKPYKLASPTSSTKHSNLSSGPSTPNTVTGNAIDDVYDMTNSASINPSSVPPNGNANAGGGGSMSHDDMMHMRHEYQVNFVGRKWRHTRLIPFPTAATKCFAGHGGSVQFRRRRHAFDVTAPKSYGQQFWTCAATNGPHWISNDESYAR